MSENCFENCFQNSFHGKIDRKEAEKRLQSRNIANSFLVRFSSNQKNCYVLSFLSSQLVINHFRVQHIFDQYFIGGKHFQSLNDLLLFYTKTDLLRSERLLHPLQPFSDVHNNDHTRTMVAILPYHKVPDSDELSLKAGDLVVVENALEDGQWFWATNQSTGESGLVFEQLLREHESTDDWFHPNISKEEAIILLQSSGSGSFLVRPSDNSWGDFSLFFFVENCVQRFRIERKDSKTYILGQKVFKSVKEIVEKYMREEIVEKHKLVKPVIYDRRQRRHLDSDAAHLSFRETEKQLIYQTLRESRENCKKCLKVRGFLWKKSKKSMKKWKKYYFYLEEKENYLYFVEKESKRRPKGLIDLSFSYLYSVLDSLFDKQFVFQLVERALPCISTVYFLCALDSNDFHFWLKSLAKHVTPQLSHVTQLTNDQQLSPLRHRDVMTSVEATPTVVRSLFLTIIEGKCLPTRLCPHPFLLISYNNNIHLGKTSVKCPPDPIYEEEFPLEEIPCDVTTVSIQLFNKKFTPSLSESLAEVKLDLKSMADSGCHDNQEEWFALKADTTTSSQISSFHSMFASINDTFGSIRLRLHFQKRTILSFSDYFLLNQLLMDFNHNFVFVQLLEQFSCYGDRQQISQALLRISRFNKRENLLIEKLIENEIKRENEMTQLFRANSLTTFLIDLFQKSFCEHFVKKSIFDSILKVLDSKVSCELNPSKLVNCPQMACNNAENLLQFLDQIIEQIFENYKNCPKNVRKMYEKLQKCVHEKWPKNTLIRTRVVSGFVFMRLLCPAILNPKQYNLVNDIPSETSARSLILIAKSIQNLSNLNEFGIKEPWMEIVNPFILKNKSKMIKYINDVSSVDSSETTDDDSGAAQTTLTNSQLFDDVNEPPARELDLIFTIFSRNLEEIREKSENRPILKKLLTVMELLTNQKRRFE